MNASRLVGEGSVNGSLIWPGFSREVMLEVGYTITRRKRDLSVTLEGAGLPVTEVVLNATRPFFGGVRWWFLCPGLSGARCQRRTTTLYLPMRVRAFACRVCHDLTYDSVQRHDARVSRYRKHPEEALEVLERDPNNIRHLFLVLRALRVVDR